MSREELYRRAILAGASPDDEFTFGPETNDEADEAEAIEAEQEDAPQAVQAEGQE